MDNQREKIDGFDFLQLYKEAFSELTIDKSVMRASNSHIETPQMTSFLSSENIPLICKENFLSPFVLHDIQSDVYYPVFFFWIDRVSSTFIKRNRNLPYINTATISFLSDYGVIIKEDFSTSDIPECYSMLQRKITEMMLMDKMELVPHLSFHSEKTIQACANFPFLKDYLFSSDFDLKYPKYDSLFKEVKQADVEKKLKEDSYGFFSGFRSALQREEIYGGTKVTCFDDTLFESFLLTFLFRNAKKEESTLFVCSQERKEKIEKLLLNHGLSEFCNDVSPDFFNNVFKINLDNRKEISQKEEKDAFEFEKKKRQFLSFEEKREESYRSIQKYDTEEFLKDLPMQDYHLINIDFSEYAKSDYFKDKRFFELLQTLPSVLHSYISDQPFYGLDCSEDKENYDKLQSILTSLVEEIHSFSIDIKSDDIFSRYSLPCKTFYDFKKLYEVGKLISQYNGFPRKYFKIEQNDEDQYSLLALKKTYQAISSSKLLVLNFCREDIFHIDIKKVLTDLDRKNPISRFLAKRKILSYVKNTKEIDLFSLIRVLRSYLTNKEKLDEMLKKYVLIYGDSVNNMNGVVEIESNIAYINSLREYQKKNPSFDLNHPCIKRCLKDREFRQNFVSDIEKKNEDYLKIDENLRRYAALYREVPNDYLYSLPFENLLFQFKVEKMFPYSDFKEYCLFHRYRKEISPLLSLILQRYMRKKNSLSTLKNDFIYSLLYTTYQSSKKKFEPFEKDYKEIRKQFLSLSSRIEETEDFLRKKLFYKSSVLKYGIRVDRSSFDYQDEKEVVKALVKRFPISVVSKQCLYGMKEDLYDHVVILSSAEFSNEDLLYCYRTGKKILFINDKDSTDRRILGFHETVLSDDNVYRKVFDFDSLDSDLFDLLKKECDSHSSVLTSREAGFPLTFHYQNREYGILPDVLLKREYDARMLMELREYLAIYEKTTLLVLDTYGFLFQDEKLFDQIEEKDVA